MFLALALTYPLFWNITINAKKAAAETTVRQIVDAQLGLQAQNKEPVMFGAATMKSAFGLLRLSVPFDDGFEYEASRASASAPIVVQARASLELIASTWFPAPPLVFRFDTGSREGAWSGEAASRSGLGLF